MYEMPLSWNGVDALIQYLQPKSFNAKVQEVCKRLCEYGLELAAQIYAEAETDYQNDVVVTTEKRQNGYALVASGNEVAFLEFGAGVHYNTPDYYPERPKGIVGIGEYGKGKGKQDTWYIGNGKVTQGNPATLAMWKSGEAMDLIFANVVKEVFG